MIDWLPTDILRRPNVMPEFFTLSDLPVENLDAGDFSAVVLKLAGSMKSVPDKTRFTSRLCVRRDSSMSS